MDSFGNIIVCPGCTGQFGKEADAWGRVYVPGSSVGLRRARLGFDKWRDKVGNNEKFSWWTQYLEQNDVTPITVSNLVTLADESLLTCLPFHPWQVGDVLRGCQLASWRD